MYIYIYIYIYIYTYTRLHILSSGSPGGGIGGVGGGGRQTDGGCQDPSIGGFQQRQVSVAAS